MFNCNSTADIYIANTQNGFIVSPLYPKYNKTNNCTITLHSDKDHVAKLYLLDMVLSPYDKKSM